MMNLDQTFSALADPTRRGILARLAIGETTVGELAKPFTISQPAISRHLRVLEAASLIIQQRRGKHRVCRLDGVGLQNASHWLDFYRQFWDRSLDRLDQHLKRTPGASHGKSKRR